jgi:hypothetical protein
MKSEQCRHGFAPVKRDATAERSVHSSERGFDRPQNG